MMSSSRRQSTEQVREYYRTVGRFLDLELSGRPDAAYWRRRVRALGRPDVLELGAGTGRVTGILAPDARLVVAVDLSGDMLRRASRRLESAEGVHLVMADMCRLHLRCSFDLVLAANDPFVHLVSDHERDAALRTVAEHLSEGGVFVLDAMWLAPQMREKAMTAEGWRRERTLGSGPDALSVREHWHLGPDARHGDVRYEYHVDGHFVGDASFRPRLWTPGEVHERLRSAGLSVRRMLGGYDEREWDPDTASALVVEAGRRGDHAC